MKKHRYFYPLLAILPMLLSSCNSGETPLEIELDEYTPTAYIGEEYDFTDVLYVEEGVNYQLEAYYQNYKTMEEHTLPIEDTFFFTPVDAFDITVIVNATKGKQKAKRTRIVPVSVNPERASRFNLEMCNFESGSWRGTGSNASISYNDTYGDNSKASRRITFKNSWDLPEENDENSPATVNASFNLATTPDLGTEAGIDAKQCKLAFDIKFSNEFYNSPNLNRHLFSLKIEDDTWVPSSTILNLTDSIDTFKKENTDNGWLHVESDLYENGELDGLSDGTFVITFGFFGISNATRETASIIFDNIALIEVENTHKGERETPTRNNIEMCRFEPGSWRGTGSKAVVSYDELYGDNSTSSRKITFANSLDLPDVVDEANNATVNASFNLANTWNIGVDNEIDAKKCTLSFDIKLSEEFYNTTHPYRHMFSLKIEDEMWATYFTWVPLVNDVSNFTYENTDNGWRHVSYDLSTNPELADLGNSTYVITFGFFGITNTTKQSASIVFDNIALIDN